MCNYSNHYAKVRDAIEGDRLITGPHGFVDGDTAICLKPGTELGFSQVPNLGRGYHYTYHDFSPEEGFSERAATTRISNNPGEEGMDYLEFADGTKVLLHNLPAGQMATVLQLPVVKQHQVEFA